MCTGSLISNDDGTCRSTGGFNTGLSGVGQANALRDSGAQYKSGQGWSRPSDAVDISYGLGQNSSPDDSDQGTLEPQSPALANNSSTWDKTKAILCAIGLWWGCQDPQDPTQPNPETPTERPVPKEPERPRPQVTPTPTPTPTESDANERVVPPIPRVRPRVCLRIRGIPVCG